MTGRLLSAVEVAQWCAVQPQTIRRAIHAGRLRAARLSPGGAFRIRPEDVQDWVDASTVHVVDVRSARIDPDQLQLAGAMAEAA